MTWSKLRAMLPALIVAGSVAAPDVAPAQTKVSVAALTFPTVINTSNDVIMAKGFDKAHGLTLDPVTYGTVGGSYAGIAKREIVAGVLVAYQVAKMRTEGVPLTIFATFVGMENTHIITKNPDIKKFEDLKGRTLAASVGFSTYQFLQIYVKKFGMELGKDIQVVNATTALAQAQLEAGRVDAALLWEPSSTRTLTQVQGARVILTGEEGWRRVTGNKGWDIILFVNTAWLKENPGSLSRIIRMYQDYASFMASNPDEADAIITSEKYTTKGIPPGTIAAAVRGKRLVPEVKPSWDPQANKELRDLLAEGVKEGHITPPPADILFDNPVN